MTHKNTKSIKTNLTNLTLILCWTSFCHYVETLFFLLFHPFSLPRTRKLEKSGRWPVTWQYSVIADFMSVCLTLHSCSSFLSSWRFSWNMDTSCDDQISQAFGFWTMRKDGRGEKTKRVCALWQKGVQQSISVCEISFYWWRVFFVSWFYIALT